MLEIATANGLLAAAQMNVIEFHTWNAKKDAIDKPDRMTFDLDPGEGVQWGLIQESAQLVSIFLNELGLKSFLKTSGGKGLHVVVPIKRLRDWDTVKGFSQAVVQHLASTIPGRFVAKSGARNRVGKIFIDYLRNGFGATTVCSLVSARPAGIGRLRAAGVGGAGVANKRRSLVCFKHSRKAGQRQHPMGRLRGGKAIDRAGDENVGIQAAERNDKELICASRGCYFDELREERTGEDARGNIGGSAALTLIYPFPVNARTLSPPLR